ncbi:hypothetical protein IFM12276_47960 [Nocardia sputorum]|uniref:Uncharacterized protein n=1 Tax=Nocardia sputorum TaxID=2984338 RepID=A0ABN6U941_9NOCA|nr:hypothetical protein IFM12276_47960 [Nocardia sputorum]
MCEERGAERLLRSSAFGVATVCAGAAVRLPSGAAMWQPQGRSCRARQAMLVSVVAVGPAFDADRQIIGTAQWSLAKGSLRMWSAMDG